MRAVAEPAPDHLDAVLDLKPELEAAWPTRDEVARTAPLGLTAMAEENEDEEKEGGDEEQPTPGDGNPGDEEKPEDNSDVENPSFLDEYDLGEIEDEQARGVAEAYIKRIGGAYSKQRNADTQATREARQAQEIVQGLMNPQTRPQVAQALGIPLAQAEEEFGDDLDLDAEPSEQVDALWQELHRRDEIAAASEAEQAETLQIANGIEALEKRHDTEFSGDEVDLLTLYADEFRDEHGQPDVEAAYKVFDAVVSGRLTQLTKKKAGAPRRMGKGAPASRKVDLTDESQQLAAMENAVAAARASGE